MFSTMWRVFTRPSLAEFENARADASLGRAIIATLIVGLATGLSGGVINVISVGDSLVEAITLMIITPFRLLFALIVVNAFWLATLRALGGIGEWATQTYLSALVFVPLNALSSLLGSIPTLGAVLAIGVMLYGAGVNVFALRAAHDATTWRGSNIVLRLRVLSLIGALIGWVALSSIPR